MKNAVLRSTLLVPVILACANPTAAAEDAPARRAPMRDWLVKPVYPVPYGPMPVEQIRMVLGRVYTYLDEATPAALVDEKTGSPITDYRRPQPNAVPAPADFHLTNYQWGVTYAGMLNAGSVTGDERYTRYVAARLTFITQAAPLFREALRTAEPAKARNMPFRGVNAPHSLDDAGAMAAAFIKASRAGIEPERLRPQIETYMRWVTTGQKRFPDGTLARDQPKPNSLWLDDLYMSVPALAQMGALTGEARYYDDAANQLIQFHRRMFVREKGLWMHGWIQDMDPHPAYHWGRANGWAAMAAAELLSVIPDSHPQRDAVLAIYREHMKGLAAHQGRNGLWHQLVDRPDSFEETSASAMFVFAMARGINRGWIQRAAYEPAVNLGWNALTQQVTSDGRVQNTCIGTGMGFDPAFYYYRPVSEKAAHGYGPVLLAGAEMIALRGQAKGK